MRALCAAFDGLFAVKLACKDCYIGEKCRKGKTSDLCKERVFNRWSGLYLQKGLGGVCAKVFAKTEVSKRYWPAWQRAAEGLEVGESKPGVTWSLR